MQRGAELMKMPSDTHLVFLLALLMTALYLVRPDENLKTLSVMVVGAFLALAKQALDAKKEVAEEVEEKEDKAPAVVKAAVVALLLLAAAGTAKAQDCDKTLWRHVYHASRLKVIKPCVTVTGVLMHSKKEPDGDFHIQLKLDSQFSGMLNARNKSVQKNCLVIEPICQFTPTQRDSIAACKGFTSSIVVPKAGTHVEVTGPFVIDNEANHGWQEIHAPTSIKVKK